MNINTLLDDLSNAIAVDSETATWCQSTYGRDHQVYVNLDDREPPAASGCPYVTLWPDSKKVGRGIGQKQHTIEVVCVIHDESSRTRSEDNVIEYEGVKRLETFRKHVETAIAAVDMGNALLDELDIEYDPVSEFPFMAADMVITITDEWTIGSDPLT
jgi:hypothetical protein